jgi:hypothetical protein
MEPEGSLLCLQVPPPAPFLSQISPVHALPSHLLNIHLNVIYPSNAWVFRMASFPQVSPPKPLENPLESFSYGLFIVFALLFK